MKRILLIFLIIAIAANTGCGLFPLPAPQQSPLAQSHTTAGDSPAPSRTPDQAALSPSPSAATGSLFDVEGLTKEELLGAFRTVAGGSEYGGSGMSIRKWAAPVRLAVHGEPTEDDLDAVRRAMGWLNGIKGYPGISLVTKDANADIWFVKLDNMKNVVDGYVVGNWGFFWTEFDSQSITKGTVAIASDVTSQTVRNHLILEELIQSMGLMQDQYTAEDSIFYGNWTTVQQPSEMDRVLAEMLYLPEVRNGMEMEEAIQILRDAFR